MFRSTIRVGASAFPRLRTAIGVTRVARVTGLDRAGVEVACAIRPQGHVLQVSNGKGERFVDAVRGAVLEAAELFASTLDVYLTLGDIESNPLDLSTADGRPSTADAARDPVSSAAFNRLARGAGVRAGGDRLHASLPPARRAG